METNDKNYDIDEYEKVENEIINYGNINNTSEKDSRVYRVYAHICKVNGKMYIGQTCRSLKKRSGKNGYCYGDSLPFSNAIKKYGWDNFIHIVLIDGLSKEMADVVEIELIKKYNTRNNNYGYNLGLGGKLNIEPRHMYQYDLSGNFLKEYNNVNDIGRDFGTSGYGVKQCLNGKAKSWRGYMWRYEKFDKIPPYNSHTGDSNGIRINTTVYQYDLDGNYITKYDNVIRAEESFGIDNGTAIYGCLRGACKSAHGFQWSYIYYDKMPKYIGLLNSDPLYQYDLDGNYLCEYNSIGDARKKLGVYIGAVSENSAKKFINGVMFSHGFYWSYNKYDKIDDDTLSELKTIHDKRSKTVYKYSFDGKFIDTFCSIAVAALSLDNGNRNKEMSIRNCCKRKYHTAYNYIWSYKELSKEEVLNIYHKSDHYRIKTAREKKKNND